MDRLAELEDRAIAILQSRGVSRLLAAVIAVATVVHEASHDGRVNWPHVAMGVGASLAAYGSVHRVQ